MVVRPVPLDKNSMYLFDVLSCEDRRKYTDFPPTSGSERIQFTVLYLSFGGGYYSLFIITHSSLKMVASELRVFEQYLAL